MAAFCSFPGLLLRFAFVPFYLSFACQPFAHQPIIAGLHCGRWATNSCFSFFYGLLVFFAYVLFYLLFAWHSFAHQPMISWYILVDGQKTAAFCFF
jgi:hypothetical protein